MPKGLQGFQKGHGFFGNEETRKKMSCSHKKIGVPWLVGKSLREAHKKKISHENIGKHGGPKPWTTGEKSYIWKGESASYDAKHKWLVTHYGKANKCQNDNCKFKNPKRFEWANISKKYYRRRDDFIMLCCSCHRKWDMGKEAIIKKYQ